MIFAGATLGRVLSGRWEVGSRSILALVVLGTWRIGAIANRWNRVRLVAWIYEDERDERDEEDERDVPLISPVLFLAAPRRISADALRAAAHRAGRGEAVGGWTMKVLAAASDEECVGRRLTLGAAVCSFPRGSHGVVGRLRRSRG